MTEWAPPEIPPLADRWPVWELGALWAGYVGSRISGKLSPLTWDRYRDEFETVALCLADILGRAPQVADLAVPGLLPQAFAAYTLGAHRKKGGGERAKSTVAGAHSSWNGFLTYLVAAGLLAGNPIGTVERPSTPRTTPKRLNGGTETLQRLLESARRGDRCKVKGFRGAVWPERDLAVLAVFITTGVRKMEAAGLNLGHYDQAGRTLHVVGKGSHERWLPVGDELAEALTLYQPTREALFPLPAGRARMGCPLLLDDRGDRLKPGTVTWLVERCYDAAAVRGHVPKGASVHAFRHTYLSELAESGADAAVLQQLSGHADMATLQRYVSLTGERIREVAASAPTSRALGAAMHHDDESAAS